MGAESEMLGGVVDGRDGGPAVDCHHEVPRTQQSRWGLGRGVGKKSGGWTGILATT